MDNNRFNGDYIMEDPCILDPDYPAYFFSTSFMSGGSPVQATMWVAQGPEAKGCVVISPQIYSGDNMESAVPALLSAGIHVLAFHPRGLFDTQNLYTLGGAIDDIKAAVAWLSDNGGAHESGDDYGSAFTVDPNRIAVMGASGGGGCASFAAAAESPNINVAIALSPANIERHRGPDAAVEPEEAEHMTRHFATVKKQTAGRIDLPELMQRTPQSDLDRLSIIRRAPELAAKSLLVIGGSWCRHAPIDLTHRPIVEALRQAGAKKLTDIILETNAQYLTKRIAVTRIIVSWLKNDCGF